MKLSQLAFFCAVVEQGTVAAAAAQLNCVSSNITTRVRELEDLLGVSLFSREKNRLLVTPEGRLFYQKAKQVLATAQEARALFKDDAERGVIRVGALDVALMNHLPERIARYRANTPHVELHIRPEPSLMLEQLLMDGELDLILTDGPIVHPLLVSRLAFRERLVLVTPKALSAPTVDDLSRMELYVFGQTCHYRRQVDRYLETSKIKPRSVMEIESFSSIFACIEAGVGFSCLPESVVEQAVTRHGKIHFERADSLESSDIYYVWRKNYTSPLIHRLIESLEQDL
ncbi:LysR family transcriptional regulator [Asaia siamensis]